MEGFISVFMPSPEPWRTSHNTKFYRKYEYPQEISGLGFVEYYSSVYKNILSPQYT